MSFQEKRVIASIFTTVLVFGIYYAVVFQMYQNGRFDAPDATRLVGRSVLLLIVASIIVIIIVTIIFSIVFAIAERESHPSFVVDERDRLIELRGLRLSTYITGGGFVFSMAALALGQSPFLVFNLIVAAFALGDLISNVAVLRIHRQGF